MPAAFSPDERGAIEDRLVAQMSQLMPVMGLRKLPVEQLAVGAGISKGAFYGFFDSKESLLAEVLARQAPEIGRRIIGPLEDKSLPPRAAFDAFLRALMAEYETNPVLKRLLAHPDELEALHRRVGDERLAIKQSLGFAPLMAFFERARATGDMADVQPAHALGVVVALPHLLLHRTAPGISDWAATQDALISAIVAGLFPEAPDRSQGA